MRPYALLDTTYRSIGLQLANWRCGRNKVVCDPLQWLPTCARSALRCLCTGLHVASGSIVPAIRSVGRSESYDKPSTVQMNPSGQTCQHREKCYLNCYLNRASNGLMRLD
jgi:hypothetical protein